jgi:hypothetical protein
MKLTACVCELTTRATPYTYRKISTYISGKPSIHLVQVATLHEMLKKLKNTLKN